MNTPHVLSPEMLPTFPDAPEQMPVDNDLLLTDRQLLARPKAQSMLLQYGVTYHGEHAGVVQLYNRIADEHVDLAYARVDEARFAHQGIITRAARRLCRYAFETGIGEVQLYIHRNGTSGPESEALAKRLGARKPIDLSSFGLWTIDSGGLQ